MQIKPIRTEEDYEATLKLIEPLMDAEPGSAEEELLEILGALVENYEARHYPMDPPDPIEALEYYLERNGLERSAFIPILGTRGRVHEIMNRRRPLSINMIRALAKETGIPVATLAQEYELLPYQSRKKERVLA